MRIVHITPSLASGGAERMLSKICEYDNENEHIVISLLDAEIHYNLGDTKVIELSLKNTIFNKIRLIKKLYKIVKEQNPDIIQTWMKANSYGIILSYFKSLSNVTFISNFRNGYSGTRNKLICKIYNKVFNKFDGHIFVSNSALNERLEAGLKFNNYKVITNGFSIPSKINEIDNDTLSIGHMGRFHEVKNQQMLIDAFIEFSKEKDTELILAGKGLNNENLIFINTNELKITILDELKDVDSFYKKLDVFVLTSFSEGFPNVVGEAMSHGVPVITTDAGESWNIIRNTGFKITNKKSLKIALNKIYDDRTLLKEKSILSRKRIADFYSLERIIKEYQDFYYDTGGRK